MLLTVQEPERPQFRFGENAHRLRLKAGLTQEQLAERAGIDRRYVQRIEAGTANPGTNIVARVRDALGCSWTQIVDGF
jgi:transcriptional regulator with XRE-family HTH domain